MKLRKPCVHGRYDNHPTRWDTFKIDCPGGDFLADDALIIALVAEGILIPHHDYDMRGWFWWTLFADRIVNEDDTEDG